MNKIFLFILIFLSVFSNLYAFGEKTISLKSAEVFPESAKQADGSFHFSKKGTVKAHPNMLSRRLYGLSVSGTGEGVTAEIKLTFYCRYAEIGSFAKKTPVVFGENILKECPVFVPLRADDGLLEINFSSENDFLVSDIVLTAKDEPDFFGYFIDPFYKNTLTEDYTNIVYRFFANFELLKKDTKNIKGTAYLKNETGREALKTNVSPAPEGFVTFRNRSVPEGNYILSLEWKEKDTVIGRTETPLTVCKKSPWSMYIDPNGRLWKDGSPYLLIGLAGNTDCIDLAEAKEMGINTLANAEADGFFSLHYAMGKETPSQDTAKKDNFLTVYETLCFSPSRIKDTDFIGFRFKENIYEKCREFFDEYGFYYPLINISGCSVTEMFENFAASQTGIIFYISQKEDLEKIKPFVGMLCKYRSVILSNEDPETSVYGNMRTVIRRAGDTDYIFLLPTGETGQCDIVIKNNKYEVFLDGEKLSPVSRYTYRINLKYGEMKVAEARRKK